MLSQIDRLLDEHTNDEIAAILNERNLVSGGGKRFTGDRVERIARRYGLKSRYARLRERGLLNLEEVARQLEICKATVKLKRAAGSLGVACHKLNDMGEYLYEDPIAEVNEKPSILTTSTEEA